MFHLISGVMVRKTAKMVQTKVIVPLEVVELDCSNAQITTAHPVLLFVMALMIVVIRVTSPTAHWNVLLWNLNANPMDAASTIPGSATETLIAKMAVMKIQLFVVSRLFNG